MLAAVIVVAGGALPQAAAAADGGPGATVYGSDVRVSGRVVDEDGVGAPGVALTVAPRDGTGGGSVLDGLGAVLMCAFSLGLACESPATSTPSPPPPRTTTGGDGGYTLTIPGGYGRDWAVIAGPASADEAGAGGSALRFKADTTTLQAPDLMLWATPPALKADGDVLHVILDPPRGFARIGISGLTEDRVSAWPLHGFGAPFLDARLLEDTPVALEGWSYAQDEVEHGDGRTVYNHTMRSPAVPRSGSLLPLSRGRPCTSAGAIRSPCHLTDGRVAPVAGGRDEPAVIDLGEAVEVGLVAVRSCSSCQVELSPDGSSWVPIEDLERWPSVSAFAPPGPASARFVRLSRAGAATELSVWPPSPAASGPAGVGLVPFREEPAYLVPALALLSAVLLTAVGLAAAIEAVAGRRRRRRG